MEKSLVYAQSGGPTSVINASALGVIDEAKKCGYKVYASLFGIDGLLSGQISDVDNEDEIQLRRLLVTPASAFGSCRRKLPPFATDRADYDKILEVFKKLNVKVFVYNGGNDSMNTCDKMAEFFVNCGYECKVIGVPKTIDNDLIGTDHCPGYGSAAKYIATTCREISLDTAVYARGRVTIVEIMGRDAGWLTAASALAGKETGPDLIYLPEKPFSITAFAQKCREIFDKKKSCLVAVSEGIRDENGNYVGATEQKDAFNNTQLGGVAAYLASYITAKIGVKTRAIELSLPQRCAAHLSSKTDVTEAYECGKNAVKAADEGKTGYMVSIKRLSSSPYAVEYALTPLSSVSGGTTSVPDDFISPSGDYVTEKFIEYASPLICGETQLEYENGVPLYARLKNTPIKL
jgi:6-phosphofructokinase 1